ncbi:MAG: hypothetical protein NVSMB24_26700 [Mucilaginibacter sp.]
MDKLTILIPVDFCTGNRQALQIASLMQGKLSVEIHLLYVVDFVPEMTNRSVSGIINDPTESDENLLMENIRENHIDYNIHVRSGEISEWINSLTLELSVDLIITGFSQNTRYDEIVTSKELNSLTKQLEIPVISLGAGYRLKAIDHILFIADYEYFGKGIQIGLIKQIARAFGSTIHLLHLMNSSDLKQMEMITAQMRYFAEEYELEKYDISLYPASWYAIIEHIAHLEWEDKMDLVCLRKSGNKKFDDLFYGKLAETLIDQHAKPLLTFQLKRYA